MALLKLLLDFSPAYADVTVTYHSGAFLEEKKYEKLIVNEPLVLVSDIPAGANRIVTLVPYDKEMNIIGETVLRAVTEVRDYQENLIKINLTTTGYGNLIYELRNFFTDLGEPSSTTLEKLETLKGLVNNQIHPCLFDSKNIATTFAAYSPLQNKEYYELKPGSLVLDFVPEEDLSVTINDPISSGFKVYKGQEAAVLNGIAPGIWKIQFFADDGTLKIIREIQLKSGEHKVFSRKTYEYEVPEVDFEEVPISRHDFEVFYHDDYINKRIIMVMDPRIIKRQIKVATVYFSNGINDVDSFSGPSYPFRWSYTLGFWYTVVPYSVLAPTNQSGQPTYSIKFNYSDIFDVVNCLRENGHEGYIYRKYNSANPGQELPCIIFNRQKRSEIEDRLILAKRPRRFEDFDFSYEEDRQEISNFRRVPGTKSLYRHYHPYQKNETNLAHFGKAEAARLYYVGYFGKKYGINADINVGGDETVFTQKVSVLNENSEIVEIDNYMPEYFRKLYEKDPKNVLLLKKEYPEWGYDLAYFNTQSIPDLKLNAQKLCEAVGIIIKFINHTQGPYGIHCAIGTDRTGVVCAILAGLCGAPYRLIEEDYCASRQMGIYEYRGPGCIKFVLEQLLEVESIYEVRDLQGAIGEQLVRWGNVSRADLMKCIDQLL